MIDTQSFLLDAFVTTSAESTFQEMLLHWAMHHVEPV
jgi:hypothetical protein